MARSPVPNSKLALVLPIVATVLAVGVTKTLSEAPTTLPTARNYRTTTTAPQAPTTTKPAVAIPASASCPQWWQLAVDVGWPVDELPMLDRVIWRESRCLPKAWNGHDAGLTQINQIHTEFVAVMGWSWPGDMFNPELCLRFALKLWQGSGWRPWGF
jgi:hypothetical protein